MPGVGSRWVGSDSTRLIRAVEQGLFEPSDGYVTFAVRDEAFWTGDWVAPQADTPVSANEPSVCESRAELVVHFGLKFKEGLIRELATAVRLQVTEQLVGDGGAGADGSAFRPSQHHCQVVDRNSREDGDGEIHAGTCSKSG